MEEKMDEPVGNGEEFQERRRLVVGISGATGIAYGVQVLRFAREAGIETHLVITSAGQQTRACETDLSAREMQDLADVAYKRADVGAAIASGSFPTGGMIVAPCSVRTLSAIAHGLGDNALTRAADVTLKERRRLVLLVRETPLTLAHLRAMTAVTEMGGVVMPPVPAFYLRPRSVEDIVDHTVARGAGPLRGGRTGRPALGRGRPRDPLDANTRTHPKGRKLKHIKSLREFIDELDAAGEIQQIDTEVDWNLEIGAIIRRSYDLRAPAPLFTNITGYQSTGFRVLGAPGSLSGPGHRFARLALGVGLPVDATGQEIVRALADARSRPGIPPVTVISREWSVRKMKFDACPVEPPGLGSGP
jgi:flavin prenyltransferase